jgi:branched-chain amino acid transport system permease protein
MTTTSTTAATSGRRWSGADRGPLLSTAFVLIAGLIIAGGSADSYFGSVVILALTYAIVTAGMAVQIGFSQQVVFSQSVFMGLGAYGVAVLNANVGWPSLLALVAITIASGGVAWVIGKAVSRASGLALAVATLMFPLIGFGYLSYANWLGGSIGFSLTGTLWPGAASATLNGILTVVIVAVVVFATTRLVASDIGLEMYTLGVSENTAQAMGVRTSRRRLELFILGSVLATLGGAVYAGTQLFVPPTLVQATSELSLLIMLFVGGRRSVLGAVLGAVGIQYFTGISNTISVHILLIEGALITVVLLIEPDGIAGIVNRLWHRAAPRLPFTGLATPDAGLVPPPALGEGEEAGISGELAVAEETLTSAFRQHFAARRADESAATTTLLEVRGVAKEYGGLVVLRDIDLTLPQRGIFGLCGPNGAGKSTLLGVVGGSVRPSAGTVTLAGEDITKLPAAERFGRGVSRTFQAVHLIRGRTVLDNVAVACLRSQRSSLLRGIVISRLARARADAMEALEYLGLGELAYREVGSLTLETQRMVELARAMASRPSLLLLDEPASGLSEVQRERLRGVLRAIGEVTCVLLVEHDLDLIAAIAERILVLESGALVFTGTGEEFRSSELVNSLLIGASPTTTLGGEQ